MGEAASGEEALALAAELSPELILLDVRMPVMDGIETARRLSAEHPGAVVVLISINDPAELPQGVECCGAKALIRKQDFGSGRPHQPTARSGAGCLVDEACRFRLRASLSLSISARELCPGHSSRPLAGTGLRASRRPRRAGRACW